MSVARMISSPLPSYPHVESVGDDVSQSEALGGLTDVEDGTVYGNKAIADDDLQEPRNVLLFPVFAGAQAKDLSLGP